MPTLTLNAETHEYALDGKTVLGVSQVLALAGLSDMSWVSEEGLKRGSFVHEAIQYHIEGSLDESQLDPSLAGFLNAWKAFERESGFKVSKVGNVWQSEIKRHHPLYNYAGTIDHLGTIGNRLFVVDVKSGDPSSWHGDQLAGYAMTFDLPAGTPRPERANVYVRADGSYSFVERRDRNDFDVFKAALTIARARIARGLVK